MNRPLVWVAVSWVAGTFAAGEGWLPGLVAPLIVFTTGLLLAILQPRSPRTRPLAIVLCFFATGAFLWSFKHSGLPGDALSRLVGQNPDRALIEGEVRQSGLLLAGLDTVRCVVDVDHITWRGETRDTAGRVAVYWRKPGFSLFAGDHVRVQGAATTRLGNSNPGIYDYEDHLHSDGIYTQITANGLQAVEPVAPGSRWSPFYWASRLRAAQAEWLARTVPIGAQPFVYAVWLGDRALLPAPDYTRFMLSGTAHMLAVSGVHVGIVFASTVFALKLFMRNARRRALAAMAAVVLFALVTGASITSLRAALMVCIYLVAELFDREPDTPTALGVSAIAFLFHNPDTLYHIGFQLSYASVASILLFAPPIDAMLGRIPSPIRQTLSVSLAVQILPVPLSVYYFHLLPVLGPLVNLIAIPLLTVVLWLCFLTSLTASVSFEVATLFGHAMVLPIKVIYAAASAGAAVQCHLPAITSPALGAAGAYWVAVLLAMAIRSAAWKPGRLAKSAVVFILLLAVAFWKPPFKEPEVLFLDVGHGDATFIRAPSGATAVVDAGARNQTVDYGERVVAPSLWARGVTRIDHLVLTHSDSDHMGGARYVLDHMRVGEVVLGPVATKSSMEKELLDQCVSRAVPVRRVSRGEIMELGGAALRVLHPPAPWAGTHSDNDHSLVLRLDWGSTRVLLTGDIEMPAESEVARTDCLANVLKVPHHGSRTSSSEAFIETVRPEVAVISTGGYSGREPVAGEVLERYRRRGIPIWRTDERGGIRLTLTESGAPHLEGTRPIAGESGAQ